MELSGVTCAMPYVDQLPVNPLPLWRSERDFERMMAHYDAMLGEIQVPYVARYVDTQYGKTYVVTAGDAANPPLVLWHGMSANLTMYVSWMNALADVFYIVAPDTPGDSGKSVPNRLNKRSLACGEWAAELMDALGIGRAHHAGISQGGWLQIQLANIAPEKLITATLMSSAGFYRVSNTIILQLLPYMLFQSREKTAEKFVQIMGVPGQPADPGEVRMFELIFGFKTEMGPPPFTDAQLRSLTAPTQLLMAEHERSYNPQRVIERARRTLPNLQHAEILPGVSHGMSQRPDLVFDRVRTFIQSHQVVS